MAKLQKTEVLIITRVTSNRRQEESALRFTLDSLNLSLRAVAWIVAIVAATFTALDRPATWAGSLYRFLFVGWSDDWPWIWLAIKTTFGGSYGVA